MNPFSPKQVPNPSDVNLLEFVDQQFPDMPLGEINQQLIKDRIYELGMQAPFSRAILNMLRIGIDLEFDSHKFQKLLARAVKIGNASEKKQAYLLATEFNEKSIYGRFNKVPGSWNGHHRDYQSKTATQKIH